MRRPEVALVTGIAGGGAYSRISRFLIEGFNQLQVPFDAVYLEGPAGTTAHGKAREVRLGTQYARKSLVVLTRYLRDARPLLTVVSPEFLSPYALIAGKMAGVPVVPWEASFLVESLKDGDFPARKRLLPLLQWVTYRSAPAVCAVSNDLLEHLRHDKGIRNPSVRFEVIPNPFDPEEVRAFAGASTPTSDRPLRFCASGRLVAQKGYEVLLQAAAIFAARYDQPWELSILGTGPRKDRLRGLISELGLHEHVHLVGHRSNPFPLLRDSDVFVHAALWEGFGMVILEAMALGLPVIATSCPGGPKEILREGELGILVAPGDPQAFAAAMIEVAEDPELRQSLAVSASSRVDDYRPVEIARRFQTLSKDLRED